MIGVEVVVTLVGFGAAIAFLLAFRNVPLWAFNLVGGIIDGVLVPIAAAAVTLADGTLATERSDDGPVGAGEAAATR